MDSLQDKRPASRPWWLGFAVVGIGAFWIYGSTLLPQTSAYAKIGPGMIVAVAGGGLVVLGLVLLVQIALGERFEAQDAEDVLTDQPADWTAMGTSVLGAVIPLYTMERFGFVVSAALMFALTTRAFGSRRLLVDLAIGLALAAFSWWSFSLLGVNLGRAWAVPSLIDLVPKLSLT